MDRVDNMVKEEETTDVLSEEDFFIWLRSKQANKRLTQEMVNGAKNMIASMGIEDVKANVMKLNGWNDDTGTVQSKAMTMSEAGIEMIARFEKYVGKPYKDMVGVWTIGYGNTYYPNGRRVKESDPSITKAEAAKLKLDIINRDFAAAVNIILADEIEKNWISQNQFDALVSLAYNIGTNALSGSSVIKLIKANRMTAAADAILLWNKGKVKGVRQVINGLVNRRTAERKLFLTK